MRHSDRIIALVLLVGAVFVGVGGYRLSIWSAPGVPGPGFLPLLLAFGLAVGAVGIFLEAAKAKTQESRKWFPDRASMGRLAVLVACIGGLVAAIEPLGLLLAVGLFLLIFLAIYLKGPVAGDRADRGGHPVLSLPHLRQVAEIHAAAGFPGFLKG